MILHIDMDAFFAAIEQRDNPLLRGKPIVVGGESNRSVVCTASYEARKFGIHSAMPIFQAKEKCADLIIVPVHHSKYSDASRTIMSILGDFSPMVEPVSIDEAYMDISGCSRLFGTHHDIALALKTRIRETLSLTCSIGIAPLKYLAKIASDMNKPDGITIIEKDQARKFAIQIDIRKIPGVGKTALKQMEAMQIKRLGDILKFESHVIIHKFGKFGGRLIELANGIDLSKVETEHQRKSISNEITLSQDTSDLEFIRQKILALSQSVGATLRKKQLVCATISIKLKFSDFTQITRARKLSAHVCSSTTIYREAILLLDNFNVKKKIRLIGVGVSSLRENTMPIQMEIIGTTQKHNQQWENVDMAIDSISEKFGPEIIRKASLSNAKKEKS